VSGPLVTLKFTDALGRPLPPPSSSVATTVAGWPTDWVLLAGLSVRLALPLPTGAAPICRHWMDSLWAGEQYPASMPPVSSTCVLSLSVVETPPIVIVIVGGLAMGVQLFLGYPLVSKSS